MFGLGNFGISVVEELTNYGVEVFVVENKREILDEISNKYQVAGFLLDATDVNAVEEILKKIMPIDVCFIAMGENIAANVVLALYLKDKEGIGNIIVKVGENEELYQHVFAEYSCSFERRDNLKPAHNFAVFGAGKFGYSFARAYSSLGGEVMVFEKNPSVVERLQDEGIAAVEVDLADVDAIKQFFKQSENLFDGAVIALGDNAELSTYIALLLADYGVEKIVVKAVDSFHKILLNRMVLYGRDYKSAFLAAYSKLVLDLKPVEDRFEAWLIKMPSYESFNFKVLEVEDNRVKVSATIGEIARYVHMNAPNFEFDFQVVEPERDFSRIIVKKVLFGLKEVVELSNEIVMLRVEVARSMVGRSIVDLEVGRMYGVNVISINSPSGFKRYDAPLEEGDELLLVGLWNSLVKFLEEFGFTLPQKLLFVNPEREVATKLAFKFVGLQQLIKVAIDTDIEGKTLAELDMRRRYNVNVVGIRRAGSVMFDVNARTVLKRGDELLVFSENEDNVHSLISELGKER